jgi:hypothetical protein
MSNKMAGATSGTTQDFGSTLGSGSTSAQQPRGGYEYPIEKDKIGKSLVTFIWQRDWMKAKYSELPSIGNIESVVFDPAGWKTEYPHPAFDAMDAEDGFGRRGSPRASATR